MRAVPAATAVVYCCYPSSAAAVFGVAAVTLLDAAANVVTIAILSAVAAATGATHLLACAIDVAPSPYVLCVVGCLLFHIKGRSLRTPKKKKRTNPDKTSRFLTF